MSGVEGKRHQAQLQVLPLAWRPHMGKSLELGGCWPDGQQECRPSNLMLME